MISAKEFWTLYISSHPFIRINRIPFESEGLISLGLISENPTTHWKPTSKGMDFLSQANQIPIQEIPVEVSDLKKILVALLPKKPLLPEDITPKNTEIIPEALLLAAWACLGLVDIDKKSITTRCYQWIQSRTMAIVNSIKDLEQSEERVFCQLLVDLIDPEQWSYLLSMMHNQQIAKFLAELLRQKV